MGLRSSNLNWAGRMFPSIGSLLVLGVLLCVTTPGVAQEVRYVYDALNRLIVVVDPQGNAAEYVVDPNPAVSISLVFPDKRPGGTPGGAGPGIKT